MALFKVSNNRAQFDAAGNEASDQYGAGIRFTQGGNARVTTGTATNYNQGIPMSATGQVAIVDATAGLPAGTIWHNGLPMSGDKVCVSRNATAVVSNGLPFDSAGAVAADVNFDLNFIGTNTLNSSVTFTRASTATYFDSAGVLTSAAINTPRFDYNPATLAARGLLIEEQRTNLMLYSEQFDNAIWGPVAGTVTANATTAPSSAVTADRGVTNGVNFQVIQGATITSGATVSGSVFLKADGINEVEIVLLTAGNITPYGRATFNVLTGVISVAASSANGGTNASASITAINNGWYRCVVTVTYPATTSAGMRINAPGATGGIFLWGAQLEAGAFPTSYIPTTTTALTRSADVASVNTLSPWYNATEGTIYFEGSTTNTGEAPFLTLQNGGLTDFFRYSRAFNQSRLLVTVASGTVADLYSGNTTTLGAVLKTAGAYKVNDFANVLNAGTPVVDTSGAVPTVTTFQLGSGGFLGSLGGYIRRITYYPRRLSNAELQAITA